MIVLQSQTMISQIVMDGGDIPGQSGNLHTIANMFMQCHCGLQILESTSVLTEPGIEAANVPC
jgi:hypothetical protein